MSDSIPPIKRVAGRPRGHENPDRSTRGEDKASRSLVPVEAVTRPPDLAPDSVLSGLSAFATQVLGQAGRKRGLKGGPPVLDEAKSAYLEAEWSGPNDRRAQTGQITRTKV